MITGPIFMSQMWKFEYVAKILKIQKDNEKQKDLTNFLQQSFD